MTPKLTPQRTSVTLEVTADVDITDLVEAGWHHEDDCPTAEAAPLRAASQAIASLHRQAHPSQHADPWLCREEPCRSVSTDVLRRG
jgi:hypothetical protein